MPHDPFATLGKLQFPKREPDFLEQAAGIPEQDIERIRRGREDIEAISAREPIPPRSGLERAGRAVMDSPGLGNVLRGAWWYFSQGQPALAELATQKIRGGIAPDAEATQAWGLAREAWQEPGNFWDKIGKAVTAVRNYRDERDPYFWGEKFFGEVLLDPLNFIGWGLAGKAARALVGGHKGLLALQAVQQKPGLLARALGKIDVVDQAYITMTNLPFRAAAGAYRKMPWKAAVQKDRLLRDQLTTTIVAGLGENYTANTVGSFGHLINRLADQQTVDAGEAVIQNATKLITWADATGKGAKEFFDTLLELPSRDAAGVFSKKLEEVQRLRRRTAILAGTGEKAAQQKIALLGDALPEEIRAEWTATGVQRLMQENWGRVMKYFDPETSRAAGSMLARMIQWFPEAILSFANYGPFNVLEEVGRSISGGGHAWSLREAAGVRGLIAASKGALDVTPEAVSGIRALAEKGAVGKKQVEELLGVLARDDERGGAFAQEFGIPAANPLALRFGIEKIDRITKWFGNVSITAFNPITAKIRRAFFMDRTIEGMVREISRQNLGKSPRIQQLFATMSEVGQIGAPDDLWEGMLLHTDSSPSAFQAWVDNFSAGTLKTADVQKLVKKQYWMNPDMQRELIEALPELPINEVDAVVDRIVRQPLANAYTEAPDFVEAQLTLFASRITNTADSPAEAVAMIEHGMVMLEQLWELPTSVQGAAFARANKLPEFDKGRKVIWDETHAKFGGFLERAEIKDATKIILDQMERLSKVTTRITPPKQTAAEALELGLVGILPGQTPKGLRESAAAVFRESELNERMIRRVRSVRDDVGEVSEAEAEAIEQITGIDIFEIDIDPLSANVLPSVKSRVLALTPAERATRSRSMWDELERKLREVADANIVHAQDLEVRAVDVEVEAVQRGIAAAPAVRPGRAQRLVPTSVLTRMKQRDKLMRDTWPAYISDVTEFFSTDFTKLDPVERKAFWQSFRTLQAKHWDPYHVKAREIGGSNRKTIDGIGRRLNAANVSEQMLQEAAAKTGDDLVIGAKRLYGNSDAWLGFENQMLQMTSDIKKMVARDPVRGEMAARIARTGSRFKEALGQLDEADRVALSTAKSRSLVAATRDFKDEFTNYMDANVPDQVLKSIFPFWQYASRAWPYLMRQAVAKPGLGKVFWPGGTFWDYTDDGYIPMDIMGFRVVPIQGTILGRTRRAFRRPFSREYDGWYGGLYDLQTNLERIGFWTHPIFKMVSEIAAIATEEDELSVERIAQTFTEELPPPWAIFTESIVGLSQAAKELSIPEQTFNDLLTRPDRTQEFDAYGIVADKLASLFSDRWREYFARVGTAELGKPWSATSEKERAWLRRNAALRRLITTAIGLGTYRPEEAIQMRDAIRDKSLELLKASGLDWDEDQYEAWRKAGYSPSRLPINPKLKTEIYDMEAFRVIAEMGEPLKSDKAQRILEASRGVHEMARAKRTEMAIRLGALWDLRLMGGLSGKQWQQEVLDASGEIRTFYDNAKILVGDELLLSPEDRAEFRKMQGIDEFFASDVEIAVMAYYRIPIDRDPITGTVDVSRRDEERLDLLQAIREELGNEIADLVLETIDADQSPEMRDFWNGRRTFMQPWLHPTDGTNERNFFNWMRRDPRYGLSSVPTIQRLLTERDTRIAGQRRRSLAHNSPGLTYPNDLGLTILARAESDYRAWLRQSNPEVDQWLRLYNE